MTSSSVSRADEASADNAISPAASDGRSDAVTLSELIADAGPLPADAALECLQRVAERLRDHPGRAEWPLGPRNIFINDDGDVWLDTTAVNGRTSPAMAQPNRRILDELASLLAYLTSNDDGRARDWSEFDSPVLPRSVSLLVNRLSSREATCYASYAAIAADAASLRDRKGEDETAEQASCETSAALAVDQISEEASPSETQPEPLCEPELTSAPANDLEEAVPREAMVSASGGGTRWLVVCGLALVVLMVLVWFMTW